MRRRSLRKPTAAFLAAFLFISLTMGIWAHPAYAADTIAIAVEEDGFTSTVAGSAGTLIQMTGVTSLFSNKWLQLTPPLIMGQTGTAVLRTRLKLDTTGFSTYFIIEIASDPSEYSPGDGMCFIVYQSDADGPQTIDIAREGGSSLGYKGITADNSIAIEFDALNAAYDFESVHPYPMVGMEYPHIAIDKDSYLNHQGAAPSTASADGTPTDDGMESWAHAYAGLADQDLHVWADYDGLTGYLTVVYGPSSTRTSSQNYAIKRNVGTGIVGKTAYIGFSAATGAYTAQHLVKKWYFCNAYIPGGLESGANAYRQGGSSVSVSLNGTGGGSIDPDTASILFRDIYTIPLASQAFRLALDGEDTGAEYTADNDGAYAYALPSSLTVGSHTLKVTSTDDSIEKTVPFTITRLVLTAGSVSRTSDTAATVAFTSNGAGSYYYALVPEGEAAPGVDTSGAGTPCAQGENTLVNPAGLTAGAKDIYIVEKDTQSQLSNALKISIPAYISDMPDTGDHFQPAAYAALILLCAAVAALLWRRHRSA